PRVVLTAPPASAPGAFPLRSCAQPLHGGTRAPRADNPRRMPREPGARPDAARLPAAPLPPATCCAAGRTSQTRTVGLWLRSLGTPRRTPPASPAAHCLAAVASDSP